MSEAVVSESNSAAGGPAGASQAWRARYCEALMNTFGAPALVLERGLGSTVWDVDGRAYTDLLAGIAVNALGHAHPQIVAAVANQAGRLMHVSNFFATVPQIELAEKLVRLTGAPAGSRVFLANSGTEAVEAAIKVSRRTGKHRLIAFEGSFHGRSTGALALTSKEKYRAPFAPLLADVTFVPYGDSEALARVMDSQVAAIFVEPIQGEGGVRPAPPGFLAAVRQIADRHQALVVVDEIQTGMGRTGAWLAVHHDHLGGAITPDVVLLAKALGGGFPIGALVAYGPQNATLLGPGDHGTTFGGNPLAAAVAGTVIDIIERDNLLAQVTKTGERLAKACAAANPNLITQVRGQGLLLALQLAGAYAAAVTTQAYAAGFIVNAVTPDAIRLAPSFLLTEAEIDAFAAFLAKVKP